MPLARRPAPILLVLAGLLAGCDAGHRDAPGADNRWPGPELTIVQPGPGQVIALTAPLAPVRDAEGNVEQDPSSKKQRWTMGYRMPRALFELRNPQTGEDRAGDQILWSLDGGPWQVVEDATRSVTLSEKVLEAGSHVLQACVWNGQAGAPYANPGALAVRLFHLGGDGGERDLWNPVDATPREPFDERGAWLMVIGPKDQQAFAAGETPKLTFAFTGGRLGETSYRVRYRVDGSGDWLHAYEAGGVPLEGLAAGEHSVVVELERFVPGPEGEAGWVAVPRPFFARESVREEDGAIVAVPVPGELNRASRRFSVR